VNSIETVIITSPGGKVGEVVKRALEAHGLAVLVFDGPDAHRDTPGFLRELRKFTSAHRAEGHQAVLLPIFYPEVLAEHRDEFPGCIIPLDAAEKIKLLDNKKTACDLAASLNIPQPNRYKSAEEIIKYPVVFKRTQGHGGDSVYFPKDETALKNLISTAGEYLITDFIDGENWCVDCLRTDTSFQAAAYRVLEPKGKGVSTKRLSVEAPLLKNYCRQLLEAIDYRGVCGMDFRLSAEDGRFYFLECNPRFSGGIETTIEDGFDIVWELLKILERQLLS